MNANFHTKLKREIMIEISEGIESKFGVFTRMLIDKHFLVLNEFPLKSIFRQKLLSTLILLILH